METRFSFYMNHNVSHSHRFSYCIGRKGGAFVCIVYVRTVKIYFDLTFYAFDLFKMRPCPVVDLIEYDLCVKHP